MSKLFRYQRKGVYLLREFGGRALLADEMGLGKSIQALSFMHQHETYPTIIVCPASLKLNWERELKTHFNVRAQILNGRKPTGITDSIAVVNYDVLPHRLAELIKIKPSLLIFDEAHYCGNRRSKRTKAVRQLARACSYVVGLTGTPLINRPAELWAILNIIRPDLYRYFRPFGDRYCDPVLTRWGWKFPGAVRLPELHRTLKSQLMIRRRKDKVWKDRPSSLRFTLPIDLKDHRQYRKAENDFISWLKQTKGEDTADRAMKAQELSKWSYLKKLAAELKMPDLLEWIENFLQSSDSKLVVFGTHKDLLGQIKKKFNQQSELIDGSVSSNKRLGIIDKLESDKKCRILVANSKAAGVGLNLTMADTVLFAEIPWTPADIDQCIARVNRIGQSSKHTTAYFAIAKASIEEKLWNLIETKQSVFSATVDGEAVDAGNIYETLFREMQT